MKKRQEPTIFGRYFIFIAYFRYWALENVFQLIVISFVEPFSFRCCMFSDFTNGSFIRRVMCLIFERIRLCAKLNSVKQTITTYSFNLTLSFLQAQRWEEESHVHCSNCLLRHHWIWRLFYCKCLYRIYLFTLRRFRGL